jgi:NCAIR mutase (PurE)-related protein
MSDIVASDIVMDWARQARTGVPEAVLCASKSAAQIEAALAAADEADRPLLLTRLAEPLFASLSAITRQRLDYDPLSATAFYGQAPDPATLVAGIGIVAAGTSDLPVAREAARTLAFCGYASPIIADVGVAGLWRLLDRVPDLAAFRVIIAVAGMEGALFSVLGGLVAAPVIAVPTSVGYGVGAGGRLALHSALGSCAPGIVAVNIDNGFGAAAAAIKMLRAAAAP